MRFQSLKALALLTLLLFVASACSRGASISASEGTVPVAKCGSGTAAQPLAADDIVDGVPKANGDFRSKSLCDATC